MKLSQLTDFLEAHSPLSYQEDYDNCGLLVGDPQQEITSVLVCLDVTEEVLQEAITTGANVVIAHHPLIFRGLKKLIGADYVERAIIRAIRHDIAIYAMHTNLDNTLIQGVNTRIAEQLSLEDIRPLRPSYDTGLSVPKGIGIIGRLSTPMAADYFLEYLKDKMNTRCIRYTATIGSTIQIVAACGGSGSFLLADAMREGADVFVSGDFKYHEFFDGPGNIMIADIGHFESEQFTIDLIVNIISAEFSNFAVRMTKVMSNPIKYF